MRAMFYIECNLFLNLTISVKNPEVSFEPHRKCLLPVWIKIKLS